MPASVNWCYMNKQMALSAIWVAPLLPALGRGLTMTGQDSQYLFIFQGREVEMALRYRQEPLPKPLA